MAKNFSVKECVFNTKVHIFLLKQKQKQLHTYREVYVDGKYFIPDLLMERSNNKVLSCSFKTEIHHLWHTEKILMLSVIISRQSLFMTIIQNTFRRERTRLL